MKIGIDVRCFAHGKNTGIEEYTKHLLTALFTADSHNEYVLFFNAWKNKTVDFSWVSQYKNVHVQMFSVPNKILNLSLWLFQYPKIDQLCGGLDAFFMPNSNFVALSRSVRLYLTVHDLSFVHCKDSLSFKRRVWHFFVNPRLLINRAQNVFAISAATRADICATYAVNSTKVITLLNGPTKILGTLDRNNIALIVVKEKYHLPYHFILYFGTVEPRKNIVTLIEGYDCVRTHYPHITHKLVIAGATGWKSQEVFTTIARAKYSSDIIMISDVPEEEKESLYTLASVFVYPSFFEGFGFPPLEAMMCAVPIITSHTTSLPEVVAKHAIMIDPYRVDEMVAAIVAAVEKKGASQYITTTESLAHARRFMWQKVAYKMSDLFV